MTKKEFLQRAVIAMAGKVIGSNGTTNYKDWLHMIHEAEELTDLMIESGHL